MKQILNLLIAFVAAILFVGCEMFDTPTTKEDLLPNPSQAEVMFYNNTNTVGTYLVQGDGDYSYKDCTTEFTSFVTCSPRVDGEYTAKFISLQSKDNVYDINGKEPVYVGKRTFKVPNDLGTKLSIPLREITSKISFNEENGVKISNIIVNGTPKRIFIDGEPIEKDISPIEIKSKDVFLVSALIKIQVCVIYEGEMRVFTEQLDAQPGCRYNIKVEGDRMIPSIASN